MEKRGTLHNEIKRKTGSTKKVLLISLVSLFTIVFFLVPDAHSIPIGFASGPSGSGHIDFTGGPSGLSDTTITFSGPISVTNSVGGTVSISGGSLTIDEPVTVVSPGIETTTVTGSATLSVFLGDGDSLTGTFAPVDITQVSSLGGFNSSLAGNLTSITTADAGGGLNSLLSQFSGGVGVVPVSWNIITGESLTTIAALASGVIVSTNPISGSISVPESSTLFPLGVFLVGLIGVGTYGGRRQEGREATA